MTDGPLWVVQAIATDGLTPPRKAVKVEVMRDEEPEIQFLKWMEGQASGNYRVQYAEWPSTRPAARFRAAHEPDNWITVADVVREGSGEDVGG